MRNNENLKRFGHVSKTKQERENYSDNINGTTKALEDEDIFDETSINEKPAGNPESIKKEKDPYKSWKTWWRENWKTLIVSVIGVTILFWFFSTLISDGTAIAGLNISYSDMKENVDNLQTKYDDMNGSNIKNTDLLNEIRNDLNYLNTKYNIPSI